MSETTFVCSNCRRTLAELLQAREWANPGRDLVATQPTGLCKTCEGVFNAEELAAVAAAFADHRRLDWLARSPTLADEIRVIGYAEDHSFRVGPNTYDDLREAIDAAMAAEA